LTWAHKTRFGCFECGWMQLWIAQSEVKPSHSTAAEVEELGYRIVVDRTKCQGIGACVGTAPDVFEIDREGKAVVIDAEGADDDTILAAAEACPLEAITLFDEEGEQAYP